MNRLRIPVIPFIPNMALGTCVSLADGAVAAGTVGGSAIMPFSIAGTAYFWYSFLRDVYRGGTPMTVPIPWTTTPAAIEPTPRVPMAFPPKAGQCYVCGLYDHDREDLLGDSAHWSCVEWLGDWQMPSWQISMPGRGVVDQRPGTETVDQVTAHCRNVWHYQMRQGETIFAKLGDRVVKIHDRPAAKPIDPDLVRRFYAEEGATVTEFTANPGDYRAGKLRAALRAAVDNVIRYNGLEPYATWTPDDVPVGVRSDDFDLAVTARIALIKEDLKTWTERNTGQ